ncbi:MAG: hypothetical protein ACOCPN_00690 [Desulfonatronovibrionaceae bacterium]
MEDKIFKLGLSVEATSLYLILSDLDHFGAEPSLKNVEPRWNASLETLEQAIRELEINQVAVRKEDQLVLQPASFWTETRSA